jgi:predicted metal-dependent hydrolase
MWDILYHTPRPSSPFKDGLLEQMLEIARGAHRFYREHIGDGSLAQLLARQSINNDIALQDMEEAIEELLFDGKRVRAILQLMASREPERQELSRIP